MPNISLKPILKRTQDIVNLYIRLKYAFITDNGLMAKCFTCGKMWLLDSYKAKKDYHASHFFREDLFASVRYHHDNLRPACKICNRQLKGNLAIYGERLLDEIGEQRFKELCFIKNKSKKWTYNELEAIIKEHKELLSNIPLKQKLKLYNS